VKKYAVALEAHAVNRKSKMLSAVTMMQKFDRNVQEKQNGNCPQDPNMKKTKVNSIINLWTSAHLLKIGRRDENISFQS
jgi:hypothetical protein